MALNSIVLFNILCSSILAQTPVKVWSVDLGADEDFKKRLDISEVLLDPPSISFLDASHIICSFYDGEKVGFNPTLTEHGYHILAIDAKIGAFAGKLDFKSVDDHSMALPVADGGFVVLAGQQLRKYSYTLTAEYSYATPINSYNGRPNVWLLDVGPGGHTLLLYSHHVGEENGRYIWLRSVDLSPIFERKNALATMIQASDTSAIFDSVASRSILAEKGSTIICKLCRAYFLSNDQLFVESDPKSPLFRRHYQIEMTSGEKTASGHLGDPVGDFTRASNVPRIAYLSGHFVGSGEFIKRSFHALSGEIVVLDWKVNRRVAAINLEEAAGNPSAGLTQSSIALSPDGKFLLLLLHHTLTYYRLP